MPNANTVFMFSGQGSQYHQMGKQLFDNNAVFREWLLRLDAMAHELTGERVLAAIYGASKAEVFDRTRLTHPAIFMVEYALAQCLLHEGVRPTLTLGASLGAFAAATVAGYLDVEDALIAVVAQADAFESSCERGGMIGVLAHPSLYEEDLLRPRSEMAGINFSRHFAISATHRDLDTIEAGLKRAQVAHQRLAVSIAFHSRWIDNAQAHFEASMRSISLGCGHLPIVCCDRAATLSELPDAFFWDVVRRPIRFRDTIAHLEQSGPHRYVDVGPSGTMATFVRYGLPEKSRSSAHALLTPYGQDQRNLAALLQADLAEG